VEELSQDVRDLLDAPNLAHFVTLMKDGSPQVTPVWVDHDGAHVLINTVEGHQKQRNLSRDPRVAVSISDKERAGRYVQVRGRVVEIIRGDEAFQHVNKLSRKYSGDPDRNYPLREGEVRLLLKIAPDHVSYRGGFGSGSGGSRFRG
jgi:PPOX class probable F420-dependent enzyme